MATLEIRNISKSFGATKVLHEINLDLIDGEFLVLVGPSGCGKTTTLRMIAGLETVDSGVIQIGDKDVTKLIRKIRQLSEEIPGYKSVGLKRQIAGWI